MLADLQAGEVHLWQVASAELKAPELLEAYQALLTPEECERQSRFYFEEHRRQFLLTRALVRCVLSQYWPLAPAQWRFCSNEYGKPEIAPEFSASLLRFNLAHTRGLIVCAVGWNLRLGVDVECAQQLTAALQIAEHFFSPAEVAELRQYPSAQQSERFLQYWTLKEAYIKAQGQGLSLSLQDFSFRLPPRTPHIEIEFSADSAEDPALWRFYQIAPQADFLIALALKTSLPIAPPLKFKNGIPFTVS